MLQIKKNLKYVGQGIVLTTALLSATQGVAQVSPLVNDIAPYVYPQNRQSAPKAMTYMPDGVTYLELSSDGKTIVRYDIKTGKQTEVFFDVANARETKLSSIEGFTLSPDASKIMVWVNRQDIYRRSYTAEYYVYEVRSRLLRPLSHEFKKQQAPIFSPDSRMVAFVVDNNVYVAKLDYETEVAVTTDGKRNEIINGVPDWTYEEEFSTNVSMSWAPDNSTLCFLKYNESQVPMYSFPVYEGSCDPKKEYAYYPGQYTYKYPVAGETNSKVTLHSYDIETRKVKDIALPDSKIEYIPSIEYQPEGTSLIVSTLNRDQNRFEIYSVNPKSTVVKSIYVEESKAWILPETYEDLYLGKDYFVVMSSRSGYTHLYAYSYTGSQLRAITSGQYDVTAYYGADALGNHYYQTATPTPMDRTIHSVNKKGVVTDIANQKGTTGAKFTPNMDYMLMSYSNANTPSVYTIATAAGKTLRTLVDNSSYAAKYSNLPKKEFFTMTSDGNTLNGYMIKPTDFNESKKYPVVMFQYSGPGSQQVLNKWAMDWDFYFAKQGYIVICVDGRGTGGRGRAFSDVVYKQLGKYETIDQLAAARYAANLPYVDAKRIGIFGWSYGGYETLMAASADGALYAAAVAVAPVTDWRYYDTIYAERYMLTPQQNESGYNAAAPINRVAKLACPLLIMSGTADDNVHHVNTLQYVSNLQSVGGLCDMFIFPNMNHSINYCNARAVVYAKMLDYFNKTMK
jgi:dipeptidyl-peptidase-4